MNGDKHDHISILQHKAESCVTPLHQNIPNPAFMIRGLSIESQNSPNLSVFISADLVILHSGKPLCAASVPSSFSSPLIPPRSYASSSVPQPSVPLFANRAIPRVRTEPTLTPDFSSPQQERARNYLAFRARTWSCFVGWRISHRRARCCWAGIVMAACDNCLVS
jgi:hypothetical protein